LSATSEFWQPVITARLVDFHTVRWVDQITTGQKGVCVRATALGPFMPNRMRSSKLQ